jgi:hypothetical protein
MSMDRVFRRLREEQVEEEEAELRQQRLEAARRIIPLPVPDDIDYSGKHGLDSRYKDLLEQVHRDRQHKEEAARNGWRNRNVFRDEWFNDGCYFSEDGCVIYLKSGEPFCYFDDCTNTFHSYKDGRMIYYYDMWGERLWPMYRNGKQALPA